MRFYPVLATVVAITTPLSSSMAAQAQTPSAVTEKSENITVETTSSPPGELESEVRDNAQNQRENQPQTSLPIETQDTTVAVRPESIGQENQQPAVNSTVDTIPTDGAVNSNKLARLKAVLSQSKAKQGANSPQAAANYPITTQVPNRTTKTAAQLIPANNGKSIAQTFPPETPTAPAPLPDLPTPPNQQPGIETPRQIPNNTPVPQQQPQFPNTPTNNQPGTTNSESEPQVLVAEVLVRPETGQLTTELENEVYRVIRTQPGRTTTRSQLQQDINAIFATGFFANVQAVPEDTPVGVRVSFVVQPNPILTKVEIQANPGTNVPSVLPPGTVDQIFKPQYGRILNLRDLQEGIKQLNKRYQDQGYVLANVIGSPQVTENGVVTLQVAEGVVENVRVRFRNKEGQDTDDQGRPIRGRTKEYIITREVELKPGQVFNRNKVQRDLQRVFNLGLFEDLNISLDPGQDPSKVNVVVNVVERNSGSIAAGAGISSASGLFGTVSYQEQNFGGRNQKLGAEIQVGQRELLFDLRFTDPWIAGDPYRTSYTGNIFRRRSISLIFDGKDQDIRTFDIGNPNNEGDRPRVLRLGGGINFTRPLSRNPFERSEWVASAGLQYQRVSIRDADGDIRPIGRVRNDSSNSTTSTSTKNIPLSFSDGGEDDLLFLQLGASRDRRNSALQPTQGSFLRFGVDQSVPVGLGNIFLTRLRGSYSHYFPVQFIKTKGPQTLAFNVQGGTILGDLPPYEAFTLGGSNSVRGYEEGGLGSGRSFLQATAEYRFPLFSVISGAVFFDVGSDLGTTTEAARVLNKDGFGYGYGLGVRIQSPLGPIRIDYGINDDGDNRINFGIGERF
ncbi:BamA/TamA family outer membrane protein [Calothrix sp. NIES-3974]|uniref:BamA/TamA family outer membrane protein n=1 Tax=Calothrix sp. NIES-3974 TaxID=2005462 RepID=UPI000B61A41C|nr:BamA/TamA family outer membrane protein [Calothrix sp. NIES-3974]BAZ05056.1 surface antigen D15 domain-containing protein [Calothrix sp. NIES-3974]